MFNYSKIKYILIFLLYFTIPNNAISKTNNYQTCRYCKKLIQNKKIVPNFLNKFILIFDNIECMIEWSNKYNKNIKNLWINDLHNKEFYNKKNSFFIQNNKNQYFSLKINIIYCNSIITLNKIKKIFFSKRILLSTTKKYFD